MIYIESRHHSVLYSGDFSIHSMFGVNGMRLLTGIAPDTLLLNAPNTYMAPEAWTEQIENPEKFSGEHNQLCLASQLPHRQTSEKAEYLSLFPEYSPPPGSLLSLSSEAHFRRFLLYWNPKADPSRINFPTWVTSSMGRASGESPVAWRTDILLSGKTAQEIVSRYLRTIVTVSTPLRWKPCAPLVGRRICPHNVFLLHVKPDNMQKSLVDVLRKPIQIYARQAVNSTKNIISGGRRQ